MRGNGFFNTILSQYCLQQVEETESFLGTVPHTVTEITVAMTFVCGLEPAEQAFSPVCHRAHGVPR